MSESAVEKIQFSGAVQEIQTLFFDVYAKFENFEAESQKQNDAIQTLKNELRYSEKKRAEITAKYSNLRVRYKCDHLPYSNNNGSTIGPDVKRVHFR